MNSQNWVIFGNLFYGEDSIKTRRFVSLSLSNSYNALHYYRYSRRSGLLVLRPRWSSRLWTLSNWMQHRHCSLLCSSWLSVWYGRSSHCRRSTGSFSDSMQRRSGSVSPLLLWNYQFTTMTCADAWLLAPACSSLLHLKHAKPVKYVLNIPFHANIPLSSVMVKPNS